LVIFWAFSSGVVATARLVAGLRRVGVDRDRGDEDVLADVPLSDSIAVRICRGK